MLSRIITEELISLHVAADTWEEAICRCVAPLVAAKRCAPSFVDAMVETARAHGPYIVITKQVAMPHARPEQGALELGLSVATLARPVEFGNAANDPVRYVFGLCAPDDASHIAILSELVDLLEQDGFYTALDQAERPGDVLSYIREFEARFPDDSGGGCRP